MRTKATHASGSSKVLKKGAVSTSSMKNGEEILQYHNGKLKVIRKEFGKMFELEFVQQKGPAEQKELKTFAKNSDVKKPQKDAIKVFKDGVRVAKGKNTYFSMPSSGDSSVATGETEQSSTSGEILIKP